VSAYDHIARLYDPWSRSVVEDVKFYVDEAVRSGGPVLELGVGTARVAVPMAAAGIEVVGVDKRILTEGWSIHELGTARMGTDPKTSVLNQFQQSHDVKNLSVVDGSSHVSASCQNPTWTIMSLAWRSCEYLADEFKKGNL